MTELDELKDALREPPDFAPRPLDLAAVMSTGGRIRRRRWLAVGTGTGLAVLALLVGGNALVHQQQQQRSPGPAPGTVAVQPAAADDGIIRTGLKDGGAEWVLYAKPVVHPTNPQITFGLMLGRSIAGGEPAESVMSNEVNGSDTAPGFHAVQGSMRVEGNTIPTFGYYAGPATKITATVDGETVTASQAPLRDGIVAFWIKGGGVKDLTAYDATGEVLVEGNSQPGVG